MHYNELKTLIARVAPFISSCLSVLFWFLLVFAFDTPLIALITLISVAIHEFGHEVCLYLQTGKLRTVRGVLNGFKLSCSDVAHFSYKQEALLYASGPLANIFIAILYPAYASLGSYGEYLAFINLTTAVSNLILIKGYDGYGILYAALRSFTPLQTALRICGTVSAVFTVTLCITSLYLIDRLGEGYWIFFVFLVSLISSMAQSLKNTNQEQ